MVRAIVEGLISFFLVSGGLFALVGAIGLVRFPDFMMRLHAPTKSATLGVGGVLVASLLYFAGSGRPVIHELLISAFIFVTAPVSALTLARAAMRLGLPSRTAPEKENRA
jgi:multicomponent K+:H+ antiporter subunit G